MNAPFDVHDRASWYHGQLTRQEADELLLAEREPGVFLVRDSNTSVGDFVLCVKEDVKISHFIINKIQLPHHHPHGNNNGGDGGGSAIATTPTTVVYRIGDQTFVSLPELLAFYILHYLDTTPLRRPLVRRLERVVGKFDFEGRDADDLPFKKGDILDVLSKDEEQWWTARNAQGLIGQIPVPYVQKFTQPPAISQRKLPAYARVKQARVPNAYDKTALKLEIGDVLLVTKTNINGQWEGELKGKTGHFPFTHVEFLDSGAAPTT